MTMGKQRSDNEFFENEIVPHYTRIVKFVIHTTNDDDLARDIAQDTMEAAWKYIKKLRKYDSIEAGLITIAKNQLKKHYKNNPLSIPIEEFVEMEAPDMDLEKFVTELDSGEELKKLFSALDEKQVRIMILHYYYDLSLKEITKMYGLNYNSVVSWHSRILKKMQKELQKNVRKSTFGEDDLMPKRKFF